MASSRLRRNRRCSDLPNRGINCARARVRDTAASPTQRSGRRRVNAPRVEHFPGGVALLRAICPVRKEIRLWTGLGRVRQLLIVLTDGEIGWSVDEQALDGARTTALPDTLRAVMRDEPLYTDLRWVRTEGHLSLQDPRFTDAVASLAATIRGTSKDDLYGEHVSQHQRLVRLRRLAVSGLALLAVAALAAALVAFGQRNEARRQAQIALGRQLAAQADAARAQRSQLLPYSLLLGVEPMRAFPSVEADQAIRGALARLPALVQVTQQPDAVEQMVIHAGTGRVAAATSTGVVLLWGTGGPERRLTETRKGASPIVFSPDGRFLATIDRDQSVRLWDADTGRGAYPPFRLTGQTMRLAFSPDTRMLAATSVAGSASGVSVWDVATGGLLQHLPLERARRAARVWRSAPTDGWRLSTTRGCASGTPAAGASCRSPTCRMRRLPICGSVPTGGRWR